MNPTTKHLVVFFLVLSATLAVVGAVVALYIRSLKKKISDAQTSAAKTEISDALKQETSSETAISNLNAVEQQTKTSEKDLVSKTLAKDQKDATEDDASVSNDLAQRGFK